MSPISLGGIRFCLTNLLIPFLTMGVIALAPFSAAHALEAADLKAINADPAGTDYRFVGSNEPAQIFWPEDKVSLNFDFAKSSNPGDFSMEVQEITTRQPGAFVPGETGPAGTPVPLIGAEGQPIQVPMAIAFTDQPRTQFKMDNFPLPAKFGTYAMVLKTGGKRIFLGTLARVPATRAGATVDNVPIFGEGALDCLAHPGFYARMGVKGWRMEGFWNETKDGTIDWSNYDKVFASAKQYGCQIMITMEGSPEWSRPFGVPTPAVGWTPASGGMSGSGDWLLKPEYYDRYGKWIHAFVQRYWEGGNGGLYGIENYNEPWDGGGISGWASDIPTYRKLQMLIASNAKSVDPKFPILAACSIMNTEDKLYSDGTNDMDKYIDAFTDHYVSPVSCYGPEVAKLHGKESMDTETWFADSEFSLPQAAVQYLACGQNRLSPWHPSMLFDTVPGAPDAFFMPRPLVAASAAFNQMITGLKFNKMIFQEHLPFAFQFGEDQDKDGVVVMFGQLTPIGGPNYRTLIWNQVNSQAGGTITIDNSGGNLEFFDLAGNAEFQNEKSVTLPLNASATYMKSPLGPQEVAKALASAKITGKRFIEIVPHDFSSMPNQPGTSVKVELRNRLNEAVTGSLKITAPDGMTIAKAEQPVSLSGGETKVFEFPVTQAQLSPTNTYPCKFEFTSSAGNASYAETLNAAVAPKRTIKIDGNADAWADVPGINVIGSDKTIDLSELARKPWLDIQKGNPDATSGEFKMAWDENFIYVFARVNDTTPEANPFRFADRDENSYFHSAASDNISPYKEFIQDYRTKHNDPSASFAEVPYVYCKDPSGGDPTQRDRLQLAFNVMPGDHGLPPATSVPKEFHAIPDTDYEYSLYWVNDGKDGGGELYRLLAPGMPRVSNYPHEPRAKNWTGPVPGAQIAVKRDGNTYIYEAAIPKAEIADLKLQPGTDFGFTFQIGNSAGANANYGADKAITKNNGLTMHPYYKNVPNTDTRWTLIQ